MQYNITHCIYALERTHLYTISEGENVPGITKLVGIYDADGGIFGEIKYFAGKIFANQHCSLCDITHGKSKDKWAKCQKRLPITIDFIHLNERSEAVQKYTKGVTPCVIGKTATGYVTIVTKKEMNDCQGDVERFEELINKKLQNQ